MNITFRIEGVEQRKRMEAYIQQAIDDWNKDTAKVLVWNRENGGIYYQKNGELRPEEEIATPSHFFHENRVYITRSRIFIQGPSVVEIPFEKDKHTLIKEITKELEIGGGTLIRFVASLLGIPI